MRSLVAHTYALKRVVVATIRPLSDENTNGVVYATPSGEKSTYEILNIFQLQPVVCFGVRLVFHASQFY